jgi:hypothetical protein
VPEAIFDEWPRDQALERLTTAVDVAYAVLLLATDEAGQITASPPPSTAAGTVAISQGGPGLWTCSGGVILRWNLHER